MSDQVIAGILIVSGIIVLTIALLGIVGAHRDHEFVKDHPDELAAMRRARHDQRYSHIERHDDDEDEAG